MFKNQFTSSQYPTAINASFSRVGALPKILAPIVGEVITLPLERYKLDLKSILSVAVLQQSDGHVRYVVPLQDGIVINHPEDLFQGEDFTSCILDQRTVVTFDSTWATPRQALPSRVVPDGELPSGTWDASGIWSPTLSMYPTSNPPRNEI